MSDFFEKPSTDDAPKANAGRPWEHYVEYKSGKVQKAFAAGATPDQVNAGFSYYDNEAKQNIRLETFRAVIVGMFSGVSGNIRLSDNSFEKYWSNFVRDTRTDIVQVNVGFGSYKRTICQGLYRDIKPDLPQGVNYSKWMIIYLIDQKLCVAVGLSAQLENSLKEAIGAASNIRPDKVNIFDLFPLTGKFWGFSFAGAFEKRTNDGKQYAGDGEMFFAPVLKAGIVAADRHAEIHEECASLKKDIDAYVDARQDELRIEKQPGPARSQSPQNDVPDSAPHKPATQQNAKEVPVQDSWQFPTEEPALDPGNHDDLPF